MTGDFTAIVKQLRSLFPPHIATSTGRGAFDPPWHEMGGASSCGVVSTTAERSLDGYTFGYTARLAFCGACNVFRSGPHADSRAVYNDERRGEFGFGDLTEQSTRLFGFFDRCRPDPKAHNAMVSLCWKRTAIGEVFIKGHHDSAPLLRPGEDLFISLPGQSHIARVEDGPRRLQQLQP